MTENDKDPKSTPKTFIEAQDDPEGFFNRLLKDDLDFYGVPLSEIWDSVGFKALYEKVLHDGVAFVEIRAGGHPKVLGEDDVLLDPPIKEYER